MTTSARISRSVAASGVPSLNPFSVCKVSLSPLRGWGRRSFSSGSVALGMTCPIRIATVRLPSAEDVREELLDEWRRLESSGHRGGGYNAGWRCWGCRRFVAGPTVTCTHCGQVHGGIYHRAYATR